MNKKFLAAVLAGLMAVSVCACGTGSENKEDTSAEASADAEYNVDECVKLAEYKGLEVTITGEYAVTDETVEDYISGLIGYYGAYTKNDETVVKEDSIVNADYTGYKDGEAFENGAATNQYIDIANNSFIPGFADSLIGHKVGETFRAECTFPENYGKEELNGQTVEFEFTIHYLADPVTMDTLTDDVVKENFSFDTVDAFRENVKGYLEAQAENTRSTDVRNAIMDKLIEITEVTFPEGLLDKRVEERIQKYTENYVQDGTLEEYLQSYYGVGVDEFTQEVTTEVERDLKVEMICEAIAKNEGIEFNQEEYDEFIQNVLASGNYSTEEELYAAYAQDAEEGKEYFKKMYIDNLALSVVVDSAVVTEESASEITEEPAEQTESETAEGAENESENAETAKSAQ